MNRLVVFLLLSLGLNAQHAELDRIARARFPADAPGAAVIVQAGGKTLLRAGYGMADLEQGTKISADSVFRIGSVTKQFTSVAILQLAEAGKLSLTDPVTKFIPDYPMHGKTITVEHLLTHTSGIQSYTDKPGFLMSMRTDMTPAELIATFRHDPMQFDPGTRWAYNNSAYILLGAIIEKVSGTPYADYLEQHVYPRAGLTSTRYGDNAAIVPRRVPGYTKDGERYLNARYLSMTLPYAAGALLSSVDDLAKWNAAVAAGKLVDRKLLEKAWTAYTLADGESTGYGYGWAIGTIEGERVIQHGGGINGYSSFSLWMPDRDVYVAVLSNDEHADAGYAAALLARQAIGKPWKTETIELPASALEEYAGVYRIDASATRTLTLENGQLYSQRTGGPRYQLLPVGKDAFIFKDSFSRLTFERDAEGKIVAMVVHSDGPPSRAERTGEKATTRSEIAIDPATLGRYVGRYELMPGFVLTVTKKGDELWSAATGQPEFRIYPESEAKWFLKVVDAQLTFEFDEKGIAKSLTLHQNGMNLPAKKVE